MRRYVKLSTRVSIDLQSINVIDALWTDRSDMMNQKHGESWMGPCAGIVGGNDQGMVDESWLVGSYRIRAKREKGNENHCVTPEQNHDFLAFLQDKVTRVVYGDSRFLSRYCPLSNTATENLSTSVKRLDSFTSCV